MNHVEENGPDFCPCLECMGITEERAEQINEEIAITMNALSERLGPHSFMDMAYVARTIGSVLSSTVITCLGMAGESEDKVHEAVEHLQTELLFGSMNPESTITVKAESIKGRKH